MSRPTKAFLNFLFFLCATSGAASIIWADRLMPEWAAALPVIAVVFFAFVVAIAQNAGSDAEAAEHYAESIYFLGFLFTLVSLAVLFVRLGSGGLGGADPAAAASADPEAGAAAGTLKTSEMMVLSSRVIEATVAAVGVAVTTSIAGVLLRNIVRAWFLKKHPGTGGDLETAITQLRQIAEGMNGGFSESMKAIGSYFEERRELAGQIRRKEQSYLSGLERFTEAIEHFSKRLVELETGLLSSAGSLGENLQKQAEGIRESDESLRALSTRIRGLRSDSEAIDLRRTAADLADFARETTEFNAVLDSLIEIVGRKVDTLRRAG